MLCYCDLCRLFNKGLEDYQSISTVITLEPTELFVTRFYVIVNITQDNVLENEESFLVVFGSPDPSITIGNGAATVIILDDDCKHPYIARSIVATYLPMLTLQLFNIVLYYCKQECLPVH